MDWWIWVLLAVIVIAAAALLYIFWGKEKTLGLLKTLALKGIAYAEGQYLTNKERFNGAVDWILYRVPKFLQPFITRQLSERIVQSVFDDYKLAAKADKHD